MDRDDLLQSGLLARAGFEHAFFTRRGGVSEGPFAALNLSPDVGDRADHVQVNLGRAAAALGVDSRRLCVSRQVHGREVIVLDEAADAARSAELTADANISSVVDLCCAVRTADCVPILLADPLGGRVAAVHAGWRGVVQHIVPATLAKLVELGSEPKRLLAAIGPHISVAAFEVGEDVAEQLARASSDGAVIVRAPGRKPHVDLSAIVRRQLCDEGLLEEHIEIVPGCTYTDAARFFSYRRDGARSGRSLSAIRARRA